MKKSKSKEITTKQQTSQSQVSTNELSAELLQSTPQKKSAFIDYLEKNPEKITFVLSKWFSTSPKGLF